MLMKKFLSLLFAAALFPCLAGAQVVIDFSMFEKTQNVNLKFRLQDAKSNEPISFASVYLIPQGDTVITHFVMSDEKGAVEIKEIVPGKYEVNAEMMGYTPYKQVHELKGWEKDLGIIKLEEDADYIDASTITAIGNPVRIVKDTIEYNASSFRVGENAMLEDLLKKMPGMEVDKNGNVTVNGESVSKITVGGKTFFFDDPTMAVKNLPAKIVDKIRVIDKEKDETAFSGVSTNNDREKVMDVTVKEEYARGWFGNLSAHGGASIGGGEDNELLKDNGGLFYTNGMLAGYNENEQLTLLGNAKNTELPGSSSAIFVMYSGGGMNEPDEFDSKTGLTTSAQAGANYNTQRLGGLDINGSVNYNYSKKDAREKSSRTSFMNDGPDIFTDGMYNGVGSNNKLNASINIQNRNRQKFMLYLRPRINFGSTDRNTGNTSHTFSDGSESNRSTSLSTSTSDNLNPHLYFSLGAKDLGRKGRSLTLNGDLDYYGSKGRSSDISETVFSGYSDIRNLFYDNRSNGRSIDGNLYYTEPLGEKWTFQTRLRSCWDARYSDKSAFNGEDGSANDYYSSYSRNTDLLFSERFIMQYSHGSLTLSFGPNLIQEKNVTHSKSLGTETVTGQDEWINNISPHADLRWSANNMNLGLFYYGSTNRPGQSRLSPNLNIANPVYISAGNIYLRPNTHHYLSLNFSRNNPKTFSLINFYNSVNLDRNPIVDASWFDDNGIRYSIPVNSKKSGGYISNSLYINIPIDKEKRFALSANGSMRYSWSTGYQAKNRMPGFDLENFDYDEMMADFWGTDKKGELFYSGKSGFSESLTGTMVYGLSAGMKYRGDNLSASANGSFRNSRTRYSLDPSADMNTRDYVISGDLQYRFARGFELESNASYNLYRGYTAGYGQPELIWNAAISKSVKALSFSIKVADILNQRRSMQRSTSGEYVEDVYRYAIGRYFLAGITFNFGKMNAKNNRTAQSAMFDMMM